MLKRQALVAVILIASSGVSNFAQTDSHPVENQTQHIVVPLAANKDGRVFGDPDKPGAPYVIRIQNDPNFIVPPHWHPEDENIVVIKGTCSFGMGNKFDRSALREVNVGDYTFIPKDAAFWMGED
jgi:hypothetical protein